MATIKKYNGSTWENAVVRKYGTASEIITPPTTIYADGTAISTYTIKGNTVQNGTPTPSNPVDVNGVGNKTANLFDVNGQIDAKVASITVSNDSILFDNVPSGNTALIIYSTQYAAGTYYISCTASGSNYYTVRLFSDSPFTGATYNSYYGGYYRDFTRTGFSVSLTFDNDFKIGFIANAGGGASFTISNIMLSTTEADFEPFGYNIPILTNQGSAVNYLGSVTSAREIKKIVFTGGDDENWSEHTTNTFRISDAINDALCPADGNLGVSNAFVQTQYNTIGSMTDGQFTYGKPTGTYTRIAFKNTSCADVTAWKAYLQAQYAAGTPVTVWYVLATPQTAAVNEPLMKIGTYADTLSNATAIPTTEGANSITVDTTVQPSEFTATWTGWHNASVKEWDGSQWNE